MPLEGLGCSTTLCSHLPVPIEVLLLQLWSWFWPAKDDCFLCLQIRALLPELAGTAVARLLRRAPEISAPMRPARIAGPARIRTALLPVVFAQHLQVRGARQ